MRALPHNLIDIQIGTKSREDQARLAPALERLAKNDPALDVVWDAEGAISRIGAVTEAQLNQAIAMLAAEGIALALDPPRIVYRETLGRRAEIDHTYKKHMGPTFHFARVRLVFEPLGRGEGYAFVSEVIGDSVPSEYIYGVERGVEAARAGGLIAGFTVTDFRATLVDGTVHDIDSSPKAFEIAARRAFEELRDEAAPRLLEPIMEIEVATPEDFVGDIIGDLNSRRAMIFGSDQHGEEQLIWAKAPLANLLGYLTDLSAITAGRGSFRMTFSGYEVAPQHGAPPDDTFPSAMAMRA